MCVDEEGLSSSSTKTFKCLFLKSEFTNVSTFKAELLSHGPSLVEWCQEINLSLNINKMKELIMDFRGRQPTSTIDRATVEKVKSSSAYNSMTI
jgi:hypothetical protein